MKIRNAWGALGLIAIALAIGVAPAAAGEFTSSSSPVMLVGEELEGEHDVWTIDGQTVECNSSIWEKASQTTPTKTIPGITAAYNNCTAFGIAGATFNMGNCSIELLQPNSMMGNLAIRCNASGHINIVANILGSKCEVDIGESGNTNLAHATYTNNSPTNGKVKIRSTLTGITMNRTADNGPFCPLNGTGVITNGTFNGKRTLYGTSGINFSLNP